MNHKIDPEVMDVLRNSTIVNNTLTLPGMMAPALYKKVNRVLELAGGKWQRKPKHHLFESSPAALLGLALEQGAIVDTKKATQAFYTPVALGGRLVNQYLSLQPEDETLEPQAGRGHLARVIRQRTRRVTCVELDEASVAVLRGEGFETHAGDFLQYTPDQLGLYDAIVMNPPFSGGQDIAHVRHAFSFLRPAGQLLAIMAPGFTFQENRRATQFREFLAQHGEIVEQIPAGAFKESGTNVATVAVLLRRPGQRRLRLKLW